MADKSADSKDKKPASSGLDLSALSDLSFGPDWADSSKAASRSRDDGGSRQERTRPALAGGGKRDRRPDRPARASGGTRFGGGRGDAGSSGDAGGRREHGGRGRGRERQGGVPERRAEAPYQPIVEVNFYPQDEAFDALVARLRSTCRTYQLFEIAHLLLEKPDRFVVLVSPLAGAESCQLHYSVPDHLPFLSEAEAVDYVLGQHLERFFRVETVEVDPPKGNFVMVNRCGITGVLLGPPNYHRYQSFLQQHYAAQIEGMSFERFVSKVETVKDEAVIAEWMDQMRKGRRYTVLTEAERAAAATPVSVQSESGETAEKETAEGSEVTETAAPAEVSISFESLEQARSYLLEHRRDDVVKTTAHVRFAGKDLVKLPEGPLRKSVEAVYEKQKHFPLDTANNIRGRLRRDKFTVYKKGSKGISYVCAVKRKFRAPETVFTDSIAELIDFVESHPMIKVKELATKFLGLTDFDQPVAETTEAAVAAPDPEREKSLNQMARDLRWLVTEGYVSEFGDGSLFAQPQLPTPAESKSEKKADQTKVEKPKEKPATDEPAKSETSKSSLTKPEASVPAPKVEADNATEAEASAREKEIGEVQDEVPPKS